MDAFLENPREPADYASLFSRSARAALGGLILPPALLALASSAGYPLRGGVEAVVWIGALLAFAAGGWHAGRQSRRGTRSALVVAAGFLLVGTCVTPAFRGLQGLTGREPVGVVLASTLGAFAAGFGLGGAVAASGLGLTRAGLARTGVACAVAGGAGGALALLPYLWSLSGIRVPGDLYVRMALAVIAFLACVIVPFRWVGAVLDRRLPDRSPTRGNERG